MAKRENVVNGIYRSNFKMKLPAQKIYAIMIQYKLRFKM